MIELRLIAKDQCGDDELAAVIGMFDVVAEALGLDDRECAAILGVPVGALPLRPGRPELSVSQETCLRRVIDVGTALGLLIGDPDLVAEWMRTPCAWLGAATPVTVMTTEADGVSRVRRKLTAWCGSRFGPVSWSSR